MDHSIALLATVGRATRMVSCAEGHDRQMKRDDWLSSADATVKQVRRVDSVPLAWTRLRIMLRTIEQPLVAFARHAPRFTRAPTSAAVGGRSMVVGNGAFQRSILGAIEIPLQLGLD